MTNATHEWDTNRLDVVMQCLIGPIALLWLFLFAILIGATNTADAKPPSPKLHFTINQVEMGCTNASGTFIASTGRGGYGCTGTGGALSCTAKGSCTFTPKLPGLKISRNTTIEDLIRARI